VVVGAGTVVDGTAVDGVVDGVVVDGVVVDGRLVAGGLSAGEVGGRVVRGVVTGGAVVADLPVGMSGAEESPLRDEPEVPSVAAMPAPATTQTAASTTTVCLARRISVHHGAVVGRRGAPTWTGVASSMGRTRSTGVVGAL
jgi:hypothetical protein